MEDVLYLLDRYGTGTATQFFRELIFNSSLKEGAFHILKSLFYISNLYVIPDAVESLLKEIIKFCQQLSTRDDLVGVRNVDFTYSSVRSALESVSFDNFGSHEVTLWTLSVSLILVEPFQNGQEILAAILKDQFPSERPYAPRCDPQTTHLGFLSLLESTLHSLLSFPDHQQWTELLANQITALDWQRLDAVKVLIVLSDWKSNLELPEKIAEFLSRSLKFVCFNNHSNLHLCLLQLLESSAKALVVNPRTGSGWGSLLTAVFQSLEFLELHSMTGFLKDLSLIRKKILFDSKSAQEILIQHLIESNDSQQNRTCFQENLVLFLIFCDAQNLPESSKKLIKTCKRDYLALQVQYFQSVDPEGFDQLMETALEWIQSQEPNLDQDLAGNIILAILVHYPQNRGVLLSKLFTFLPPKDSQKVVCIIAEFVKELLKKPVESELEELLEFTGEVFGSNESSRRVYVLCLLAPLSLVSTYFGFALLQRCFNHIGEDSEILSRLFLWNLWNLDFGKVLSLSQEQYCFVNEITASMTRLIIKTKNHASVRFLKDLGKLMISRVYCEDEGFPAGNGELQFRRFPLTSLLGPLMETLGDLLTDSASFRNPFELQLVPHLLRCLLALELKDQSFFLTCLMWTISKTAQDEEHLEIKICCLQVFLEHSVKNFGFLSKIRTKLEPEMDADDVQKTGNENQSILLLLLSRHRTLRAKLLHTVNQREAECLISFNYVLQIYRTLNSGLRIAPLVLDSILELSWMTQMTIQETPVAYWKILEAMDWLVKLHGVVLEEQCSDRMVFGCRRALLGALVVSLAKIPAEKHPGFFQRALELFSQSEKDCLRAGAPFEVNLEKAMQQFPLTGFLILSIRRIEKVLEADEDPDIQLEQYLTKSLQFLKIIEQYCKNQFQEELENTGNPFPVLLANFLQQVLLSENPVLKGKLLELSFEILDQCLTQMLDLWLGVSQEEVLIRNLFLISSQQSGALKTIHWPGHLQDWIHSAGIEKSHYLLQLIGGRWMYSNAKQLYRVSDYLIRIIQNEQESNCKSQMMITAVFIAILTLNQALHEDWEWSRKTVSCALNSCTALSTFCERVSSMELTGFTEDWMNGRKLWTGSLRILGEKVEALLDHLESKTERDLHQIRSTNDALLKTVIHEDDELDWIVIFKEALQESLNSTCKIQMEEVSDSELLKTVSKSRLYRIQGRDQTPGNPTDFREWFEEDDEEGHLPRRKKQKKESLQVPNAFLAACLRESGLANSGVNEEDLSVLEDFIVPSQGRNYDEAFHQRFGQSHKALKKD